MRVTRYQMLIAATIVAGILVIVFSHGMLRWLLLCALFTTAGTITGLGVSFPSLNLFGNAISRVQTNRKLVALTFDDGPDPSTTPELLELLSRYNARATFFCVGTRVLGNPGIAQNIVAQGHQIGNHSHQHSNSTNLHSISRLRSDLAEAQQAITNVTGCKPAFFRPPMCLTNQRVFRVCSELGLKVVGYTIRGYDKRSIPAGQIVDRILKQLCPGAIVLLHDGGVPKERLLQTVSTLLENLGQNGYKCVRLDELIASSKTQQNA